MESCNAGSIDNDSNKKGNVVYDSRYILQSKHEELVKVNSFVVFGIRGVVYDYEIVILAHSNKVRGDNEI